MKKSVLGWVPVYEILIIVLGLFVSTLMVAELVRYGHDLLPILYILGLAVLLYGFVDCRPLSFRGLEVSLSFPIVLVALLLLANEFPATPRVATLAATGIAILGSLISESLRRLARPRLPIGRSLVRILFYASYQALAGFAAAQIYLKGYNLGWGQNWGRLFIQPTLAYTVVYALIYSLASQVIVLPHDWAISHLLLPADEMRFPRVDFITLLAIAPIPLALFYLFSGAAGWALIVIFLLFLGFLVVAGSYVNVEVAETRLRTKEDLRQRLGNPVNMGELAYRVCDILSNEIDHQWTAIYSAGSNKGTDSDGTVYYLRGRLEKTESGISFLNYEPKSLAERARDPAITDEALSSDQMVGWPSHVVSGEGHHLEEVARSGQPSANIVGEGEPPASNSDPYLPAQVIAMYLPVQHKGGTIGLLALARSAQQFNERERMWAKSLADAMSGYLQQIRQFEDELQRLYNDFKIYTKDPEKFLRAMQELSGAGVAVPLILDLISQSVFRNNLCVVMEGVIEKNEGQTGDESEIFLPEEALREIYVEARHKRPDMPPLSDRILENLRIIPSSLGRAFSFRYQWPEINRGPEFTRVYEFFIKAMKTRSVSGIVRLRPEELDSKIQALKDDSYFIDPQIIIHLEAITQIVECLEQDLLTEAVDRTAELAHSVDKRIADPERFIFRALLSHWHRIISTAIAERERGADLAVSLRSKHVLPLVPVTIGLRLENIGPGTAFQVMVEMHSTTDYQVIGESLVYLGVLPPLKVHNLEFMIAPIEDRELNLQFQITYRDRNQKQVSFKDTLSLREAPPPFTYISTPYIPGKALNVNSKVFYGRKDIFQFVDRNMDASASQQRVLLLIGERRIGKTSILKQLPVRVRDKRYIHVYFDCQAIEGTPNLVSFFRRLARLICEALEKEGVSIDCPSDEDLRHAAYLTFERELLPQVWERIGDRRLLIAVDEFERLDRYIKAGKLDGVNFAAPLRALVQDQDRLAFVFAGTRQLEALFSKYWSVFFNMALQQTIGFLDEEDARRLIIEPVQRYRIYDDLAVDEILCATGGHPYFLQMMCDHLMNLCNAERRSYVTIGDVRNVSDDALAAGWAHLTFVWDASDQAEQGALAGLAKSLAVDARATVDTIVGHLERVGHPCARADVREALRRLETIRHIVDREEGLGGIGYYKFAADLYRLWIQKHHSLD